MILLDAYAVLAYLRDEPAAAAVETVLSTPTVMTVVNAAEVVDQMIRVFGRDTDAVHADLAMLVHSGLTLVPVGAHEGLLAGQLRATYYHRRSCPVSLADCVAAACALSNEWTLATADPPLAELMRAEGGQVLPLADSSGRLP